MSFPLPPRVLQGPRLRLEAFEPRHAPLLLEAISASLDALNTWTPWVIPEPFELATLEGRIQTFQERFAAGESFIYAALEGDVLVGQAGMYARVGPGALEAGYFMRSDMTGRGYATEAARAVVDAAFAQCGAERVEMHCDAENVASLAVPRKLGFVETRRFEERGRTLIVLARDADIGTNAGGREGTSAL